MDPDLILQEMLREAGLAARAPEAQQGMSLSPPQRLRLGQRTATPGHQVPVPLPSALSWGCQLSGSQTIAAQEHIVATTARGAAGLAQAGTRDRGDSVCG